jgi:predicted RNase H-like HicB family nuclease
MCCLSVQTAASSGKYHQASLAEVRGNLSEALKLILETNRELGAEPPLSGARRESITVEV